MPKKYKRLIGDYCRREGIAVRPGFARHTPSRYAIILTHLSPPKLIAKTWFNMADVVYYIEHFLRPELGEALAQSIRILDFREGEELAYTGGKRLARVSSFSVADESDKEAEAVGGGISRRRSYSWLDYAAFAAFGGAALTCVLGIMAKRGYFAFSPAPALLLAFASLFVFFGTTGAMKEGRFWGDFDEYSRERRPISFWSCVVVGYGMSAVLFGLCIYSFVRPEEGL
jgi:hypothetical protein